MSKSSHDPFSFFLKYLFVLLGFFIPISVAITNIIIGIISFIWIVEGGFKEKLNQIKSSKWMLSILGLIGLYVLGMFWGENHNHANWEFQKLALLLFFPLLLTLKIDQKTIKKGLFSFLISTFISASVAILINYNIICSLSEYFFFFSDHRDISAFVKYNYHNVLLAFSCMICFYLLIEKKTRYRNTLILFVVTYLISLFTERGRAGQVLFNFLVISYIIYYGKKYSYKGFLLVALVFLFQGMIYKTTTVYKNRVDAMLSVVTNNGLHLKTNKMDIRYVFVKESLKKIFKKPILGYGTGSFGTIFKNEVKTGHDFSYHRTPHNQYIYVWFEIGFVGLILLLRTFIFQIKELYNQKNGFHRVLLPISFMFLMLVDSYFFIFTIIVAYIYLYKIFSYQES